MIRSDHGGGVLQFLLLLLVLGFTCLENIKFCYCNGESNVRCLDSEREALLEFKNGLIDPTNRLSTWVSDGDGDCCRWKGVGCHNTTGHVVKLDLRKRFDEYGLLGGSVNPSLLELKYLEYLDLSVNDFGGIPIPKFMGSLERLSYLNLSLTWFGGTIPWQLGNLSSLLSLDLSTSVNLHEQFMYEAEHISMYSLEVDNLQWLTHLSSLKQLHMDCVNLTKASHEWVHVINLLPSLSELSLSDCSLQSIPPYLPSVNFTSLAYLDLSRNAFNSIIPDWFSNITSLVSLYLDRNWFRGPIPNRISELPYLEELDLFYNSLTSDFSELILGTWPRITVLDLNQNKMYGKIPASIRNMTSLQALSLAYNEFESATLPSMDGCCNLRRLDLSEINATGEIAGFIESLTHSTPNCPALTLTSLNLRGNRLHGHLPDQLGKLKHLETLDLSYNSFSGPIPTSLGKLKHLEKLHLSYNSFSGPIPTSLGKLQSLEDLLLSYNELNGTVPKSLGQLSKLTLLDISSNSLEGDISEAHFTNLTNLTWLDMSSNSLSLKVSTHWVPPFQLFFFDMSSCRLGPKFPVWLQTQKILSYLTLSNTSIWDTLPGWLQNLSLRHLDLSHNQIYGFLSCLSNLMLFDANFLDLSNNNITGSIPPSIDKKIHNMRYLLLSGNSINGSIPVSMGNLEFLTIMDLSRNHLSGKIPKSLGNCTNLEALDLSDNNLFGGIPLTLGLLDQLVTLHLNGNSLSGELPESLKNCSQLELIDLGENRLSGKIPPWMGESFQWLMILCLRSNTFNGNIPWQLSYLNSLQVLDLSHNHLTGAIAPSFSDLKAMVETQKNEQDILISGYYEERLVVVVKGLSLEYTKTLSLLTSMDLSGNNLSGEIPEALTKLFGLRVLNLSGNHFTGMIPEKIGDLRLLESLDFSNNQLFGQIPPSITALNFLAFLNLSNNNLSGKIPVGNQLQTLYDASIYSGNPELCGYPTVKLCPVIEEEGGTYLKHVDANGGEETLWFYVSMGLGFVIGAWGLYIVLLLKKPWRVVYFKFIDGIIYRLFGM